MSQYIFLKLLISQLNSSNFSIKAHDKVKEFYKAMGNEGKSHRTYMLIFIIDILCNSCLFLIWILTLFLVLHLHFH